MSEWQEFTAKTVDEALTNAVVSMQTSSDQLEYEVIEEGSSRLLGLISKDSCSRKTFFGCYRFKFFGQGVPINGNAGKH